jgi:hypothetical protein
MLDVRVKNQLFVGAGVLRQRLELAKQKGCVKPKMTRVYSGSSSACTKN